MATPSFTVTCAYTGAANYNQSTPPLMARTMWQESPSTGVASTNTAPAAKEEYGPVVFEAYAPADAWFAYGASPSSAASPRVFILGGAPPKAFVVNPGDKFMWQVT